MFKKVPIENEDNQLNVALFMNTIILLIITIINCNFSYSQKLNNTQEKNETKVKLYAPIYSIYYQTAKWELTIENTEFLNSYVIQKTQRSNALNLIIYLEGHTDDLGNSDYNLELSKKRVETVADYLKSKGVGEEKLKISYFGKSKPETRKIAISKNIIDIRYSNRRVTIRIEEI